MPEPRSTDPSHAARSERTLLVSWLLSSPGPIVTAVAVAMSSSATQIADAIRRTVELGALITGWAVFRRRGRAVSESDIITLERRAELTVAVAMGLSGAAMLTVGVYRFFRYELGGNVLIGLTVATLGLGVNAFFWARYAALLRHAQDAVLQGQLKLYRAKTLVDVCVVLALLSVAVIPKHPATHYIDSVGSVVVAGYLLQQAFTFRKRAEVKG